MAEGVLQQHRRRMAEDDKYRKAALSIDPDAPGGAALGKANDSDIPLSLSSAQAGTDDSGDRFDDLTGDDLDQAVRDADIPGRSEMTADEKRQALRDANA